MLVCVALLWPVVASTRSGKPLSSGYMVVLGFAAAGLAFVTVRRALRIRRAFQEQKRNRRP